MRVRLLPTAVIIVAAVLTSGTPGAAASDQLLAPEGSCPGAEAAPSPGISGQEAMLCEINYARVNYGLAPLRLESRLTSSAAGKAADILACDSFSHTACGLSWLAPIRATGYLTGCWQAGENLAWGQDDLASAESTMAAWLASPPHRANILDDDYTELGVAIGQGTLTGYEGTTVWVTHFGSHCEGLRVSEPGTSDHVPRPRRLGNNRRGLSFAVVASGRGSARGHHH